MTQLSAHFSLSEFTRSDIAARFGIDNSLPPSLLPAAEDTARMLEAIRTHLSAKAGKPVAINVTSGYRSQALNRAVGSGPLSDHLSMRAIDFKAPAFGTPYQVAAELAKAFDALRLGQLIAEFGAWVHVSTRIPDKAVNRIITISKAGTQVGIKEA